MAQDKQTDTASARSRDAVCSSFDEQWLDSPQTVALLADRAGSSESAARRWLVTLGDRLRIGYTRPRTFWLPEQEAIRDRITGRSETMTISSRNRMDSHYA